MKKPVLIIVLCLASLAGFSQEQEPVKEKAVDAREQSAAKADVLLIDNKAVTKKEKRKKPKRDKNRKECSRTKS